MNENVNVYFVDFPNSKGRELVCLNEDDSFTILINSRLNHEAALEAFHHAMKHIQNDDFNKSDVQDIEYDAHYNNE